MRNPGSYYDEILAGYFDGTTAVAVSRVRRADNWLARDRHISSARVRPQVAGPGIVEPGASILGPASGLSPALVCVRDISERGNFSATSRGTGPTGLPNYG